MKTLLYAMARRASRNAAACARAAGLLALLALSAEAATPVAGPVGDNTRWPLAGSPYLVTGDVTVDHGRRLWIEPGVVVQFERGTQLVVNGGTLLAEGTLRAPITLTASSDQPGRTPQPGDWGQLQFRPGTTDSSRLSQTIVKYGSGITIQGASPVLNYLQILNHAAPAISLDLDASPTGFGLEARGNTLNGIAVPGGAIRQDVKWHLTGIPYVVSGLVTVGGAPAVVKRLRWKQPTLTLGRGLWHNAPQLLEFVDSAVPPPGFTVRVSNPAAASVNIGSRTGNTFDVAWQGVAEAQGVEVVVEADGFEATPPLTLKVVPPTLAIADLAGNRPVGDGPDEFRLQLGVSAADVPTGYQRLAGDQSIAVNIVDAQPAGIVAGITQFGNAVSSVTMSSGTTQVGNLAVTAPTAAGSYRVAAQLPALGSSAQSATQTVAGSGGRLEIFGHFPNNPAVWATGFRYLDNQGEGLRVRLIGADGKPQRPANNLQVRLTSSAPAAVVVPAEVTLPAGADDVGITVDILELAGQPVQIDAAATGVQPPSSAFALTPVRPTVIVAAPERLYSMQSRSFLSVSLDGGAVGQLRADTEVQLQALSSVPAALQPLWVSCDNSETPRSTVTLAGNSGTGPASAQACLVLRMAQADGTVTLRGDAAGGASGTAAFPVLVPELQFPAEPVVVGRGLHTTAELTLQVGGETIRWNLERDRHFLPRCTATPAGLVGFPEGAEGAPTTLWIAGLQPGEATVTMTGVDPAILKPTSGSTTVRVVEAALAAGPDTVEPVVGTEYLVSLRFAVPGATGPQYAAEEMPVTVVSSDPAVLPAPTGLTFARGVEALSVLVTPLAKGSATLTFTVPGFAPVTTAPIVITR